MLPDSILLIYGWAAILSAYATILTFITGILFFTVVKWIGKLNDPFSVFQVLLMIPLVYFFSQLISPPIFFGQVCQLRLWTGRNSNLCLWPN